jgi:predicted RNase H-like HicB family nuclease
MSTRTFTAAIHKEGDLYVALCPELDIASQGETIESARENLREAIELFLEAAGPEEIAERLHGEMYLSSFEVTIG